MKLYSNCSDLYLNAVNFLKSSPAQGVWIYPSLANRIAKNVL